MASVTTVPAPISSDAALVQAQFNALAHRHINVSFTLIAVIILALALIGAGGWYGLKVFDAHLARAEAAEARYDADRRQLTDLLAADAAQRAQSTAQQTAIVKEVGARDTQADTAI